MVVGFLVCSSCDRNDASMHLALDRPGEHVDGLAPAGAQLGLW
jgi:hypothetical protein